MLIDYPLIIHYYDDYDDDDSDRHGDRECNVNPPLRQLGRVRFNGRGGGGELLVVMDTGTGRRPVPGYETDDQVAPDYFIRGHSLQFYLLDCRSAMMQ